MDLAFATADTTSTSSRTKSDIRDVTGGDPLGLFQQDIKSTKLGRCANKPDLNGHVTSQGLDNNSQLASNGAHESKSSGSAKDDLSDLIDTWSPTVNASIPRSTNNSQSQLIDRVAGPVSEAANDNTVQCTGNDNLSDHLHELLFANEAAQPAKIVCELQRNALPHQKVMAIDSAAATVDTVKTVEVKDVKTNQKNQSDGTKVERNMLNKAANEQLLVVASDVSKIENSKTKDSQLNQTTSASGVPPQQQSKLSDSQSSAVKIEAKTSGGSEVASAQLQPKLSDSQNSEIKPDTRASSSAPSEPNKSATRPTDSGSTKTANQPAKTSGLNKTLASLKEVARKPRGNAVDSAMTKSSSAGKFSELNAESPVRNSGSLNDVPDAPRPNSFGNVSIRFSKKAMYDDSDEDEGTNIAISVVAPVVPVPPDVVPTEQSSSLEPVAATSTVPDQSALQTSTAADETNVGDDVSRQGDTTPQSSAKGPKQSSGSKKKGWYSRQKRNAMLSSTYKSRSIEYNRIFKDIPSSERLIVDFSCALQRDILVHGRLYISRDWICFYSNILRWETAVMMRTKDIVKVTKEKTALVFHNAIQISTSDDKTYFFTSFAARNKTFLLIDRVRNCATEDQPMSQQELWQWVHYSYGEDLGLSDHDDDYISLTSEEKIEFQTQMHQKLMEQALSDGPSKDPSDLAFGTDFQPIGSENASVNGDGVRSHLPSVSSNDGSKQQGVITPELGSSSVGGDDIGDSCTSSDVEDSSEGLKSEISNKQYCSDHEHFDVQSIDEVFNIPVDTMFQHLFTDSELFRNYQQSRKTFDLMLPAWPDEADAGGLKIRNISYTLTVSTALGQKISPSTERQILQPVSRAGEFYLVDTECVNGQIPYGENFYVASRYCVSRVSATRCHLRITSQIKYRKSVWGFVRTFIDKNVTAGILDAFGAILVFLRQASNKNEPVSKRPRRQQRQTSVKSTVSDIVTHAAKNESYTEAHRRSQLTTDTLVRVLCISLIILMLFNTFLMYKLWSNESTSRLPLRSALHQSTSTGKSSSAEDVVQLLDDITSLIAELRHVVANSRNFHNQQCTDPNGCS